jgi:5-methylcytosine-specific restriction enzyme A
MTRRSISTRERTALFLAAGGCCAHCRVKIQPGQRWDLDHVRPLELIGPDEPSNWQVLCAPCHRAKTADDVSRIRKAQRSEARHLGTKAPSKTPLPFGRGSEFKRKIDGSIVRRETKR